MTCIPFLKAPNVCKPMLSLIFTKSRSSRLFESLCGEAFSVPICPDQTSEVYFPPASAFCTHGDCYGFRFICPRRTSSPVCRRACGLLKQLSVTSSPPTLSTNVCQTANLLQKPTMWSKKSVVFISLLGMAINRQRSEMNDQREWPDECFFASWGWRKYNHCADGWVDYWFLIKCFECCNKSRSTGTALLL